jgi:hypothetical protein
LVGVFVGSLVEGAEVGGLVGVFVGSLVEGAEVGGLVGDVEGVEEGDKEDGSAVGAVGAEVGGLVGAKERERGREGGGEQGGVRFGLAVREEEVENPITHSAPLRRRLLLQLEEQPLPMQIFSKEAGREVVVLNKVLQVSAEVGFARKLDGHNPITLLPIFRAKNPPIDCDS